MVDTWWRALGKPLLAATFLFLALASPACDVDLMALFTGENPSDPFPKALYSLASEAKDVGKVITDPTKVQGRLRILLRTWIAFDSRFCQAPPPWAKDDPDWVLKFRALADLVGKFEPLLQENHLTRLHVDVLGFSRKLFRLLDRMPVPPEKRPLRRFTGEFQSLWDAITGQNATAFGQVVEEMAESAREYRSLLATPTLFIAHDFLKRVEHLEMLHRQTPASLTYEMSLQVAVAENAFKDMNARLRRGGGED